MIWVSYFDMRTGGTRKTDWDVIYIQAKKIEEADTLFKERFSVDPYAKSCDCCDLDFNVHALDTAAFINELEIAKKYEGDKQIIIRSDGTVLTENAKDTAKKEEE